MKLHELHEGIFDRFKKQNAVEEPAKFPSRDNVDQWMSQKVEYFKATAPSSLWKLFCPSAGDYIPHTVHAGVSREEMNNHLQQYLQLKHENPDAAKTALQHVDQYSIYNGGPNEDYPK